MTDSKNNFKKLSIQVSLNGLSFCVLDTISKKIEMVDQVTFKTELTPYLLLKELKATIEKHNLTGVDFNEVVVLHRNNLFSLVPKALFDPEELANYLKFNAKILATDQIVYDQVPNQDIICVYVPFTNINNYLLNLFGAFEFKHSSLAVIQTLLAKSKQQKTCYVHVTPKTLEICVIEHKQLKLYNQFDYLSKEDFLYYILFTYEQLGLDTENVPCHLFGSIDTADENFILTEKYIKHIYLAEPENTAYELDVHQKNAIDLTLLSSL